MKTPLPLAMSKWFMNDPKGITELWSNRVTKSRNHGGYDLVTVTVGKSNGQTNHWCHHSKQNTDDTKQSAAAAPEKWHS